MKLWLIGALMVAALATAVPSHVDAKRLGGGKSSGMQRNMPARTAPDAPPPKPATPAQGQQAAPGTPAAAGAAAAAAPKRNWMGPLAGLAAGLGIAALLSHFGMGAGAANLVMMLLVAGAVIFGVMFLLRRFGGGANRQPALAGMGSNGSSGNSLGGFGGFGSSNNSTSPAPRAEPAWGGNNSAAGSNQDAPMQRSTVDGASTATTLPGVGAAVPATTAATAAGTGLASVSNTTSTPEITRAFVPAAFDSEGFTRTAKMIFIRLQAANDTADLDDLRRFTTPELFASLRVDLQDRGNTGQTTDVTKVEADVLDVANEADRQVVSVRFHGQVVEEKGAAPVDFNEVWHLVKPLDDSRPWAIAGIEQLS